MKYLLTISMFLCGCSDQKICEMVRGAHAFYGKNDVSCDEHGFLATDPLSVCQRKCTGFLNTTLKIGNVTNLYSCSCDNE